MLRGNGRSRSQACDLSPQSRSCSRPSSSWRRPQRHGHRRRSSARASLEAAVVREMNRVRVADGLRPLRAVTEPAHGRARPLASDARARLLRPRLGGRDGIQRAHPAPLHEPRLEDVVGRRSAPREPGQRRRRRRRSSTAWLESPPHRAIILSPTWRDAGIGALYASAAPKAVRRNRDDRRHRRLRPAGRDESTPS